MEDRSKSFIELYHRDLDRLANEIEAIPDKFLWESRPGIINSCGVLAQHLIGNLHHFVGAELGNTGYARNREREFANTALSKEKLVNRIEDLKQTIADTFTDLDEEDLANSYPNEFLEDGSVNKGLMHLYGHLNYHLGQVNYLRRMIEEKG